MTDFRRFAEHFTATSRSNGTPVSFEVTSPEINDFLATSAGSTFNRGIYRIHTAESAQIIAPQLAKGFPSYASKTCFAFDWLGRQFVTDDAIRGPIYLLEPGTGEALEIPAGVVQFHDVVLIEQPDAALACVAFHDWFAGHPGDKLRFTDCVGYEIPLFLGGADDASNFEVIDLDVYWTVSAGLIDGLREQSLGTSVASIEIVDPPHD